MVDDGNGSLVRQNVECPCSQRGDVYSELQDVDVAVGPRVSQKKSLKDLRSKSKD